MGSNGQNGEREDSMQQRETDTSAGVNAVQDESPSFDTIAVSRDEMGGSKTEMREYGDLIPPLHMTSTFELDEIAMDLSPTDRDPDRGEYLYSRLANPTRRAVERRIAALTGADQGMAFASGSAAINATITAAVEPGGHIVAFNDIYGGTRTMLTDLFQDRFDVAVSFVDATDPAAVTNAVTSETTLVWLETPTNPTLRCCDLATIADGLDDATLAVDNTFASPYFQRPLELGADVVVHSTTKYINGHSDSVGGVVATTDDDVAESIGQVHKVTQGGVMAPFDAYQTLRGLRTLPERMRTHESNAMAIAKFLADDDRVDRVHYPGLKSHPQHELASRQMSGFGGMVTIELGGGVAAAKRFIDELSVFTLAASLGGVESLVEHPASMSKAYLSASERSRLGITDGMLRLSVGIEGETDLVADLETSLSAMSE